MFILSHLGSFFADRQQILHRHGLFKATHRVQGNLNSKSNAICQTTYFLSAGLSMDYQIYRWKIKENLTLKFGMAQVFCLQVIGLIQVIDIISNKHRNVVGFAEKNPPQLTYIVKAFQKQTLVSSYHSRQYDHITRIV